MAVFAGGSAAIKKAHIAKATSDLHNFQIAVEMTLNESPQVANIAAPTKKAQLEGIMDALNGNLAADYKLSAVSGTLSGNITKTAATADDASFIICQSDKSDSWGNPYFVIIDRAERGGSSASEFYMTTVTAGPNAILHLDGAIDGDDVFSLTSYADGDVISATYNMNEAAPTIVGGAEAATSYTAAMTAPVNNGVTVGGYTVPAQDAQQGGESQPAVNQSYTITINVTTSDYQSSCTAFDIYAFDATKALSDYVQSGANDWSLISMDGVEKTLLASLDHANGENVKELEVPAGKSLYIYANGKDTDGGAGWSNDGCVSGWQPQEGHWNMPFVLLCTPSRSGTITLSGGTFDD